MKQSKRIIIFFSVICSSQIYAKGDLQKIACYEEDNAKCEVVLKKINKTDDVNFEVVLIDSINGNRLFPEFQTNSTMESVSLFKINNKYTFLKEYFGNSKDMEFLTFKYNKGEPQDISYYHLESSINFEKRTREWSGKQCNLLHNTLPHSEGKPLLATLSSICEKTTNLPNNNKNDGNDILFDIVKSSDGSVIGNMTLVALDSKDSDSINIDDLGCKTHCGLMNDSVNFIGKLNGRIRVKLYLDFNGEEVTGYYYYDSVKKNIKILGKREGDNLSLIADTQGGKESFTGLINDGQFIGEWVNAAGNKRYPFSFNSMLIQ